MLLRRLRYWLTRSQREADLRREMEAHIEEKVAELIEDGVGEAEARAEARRRFGNIGLKREESREIWIARWWADFWQDVRYGVRGIRRDPGFAVIAITSAALGIGACTTIFSIVNAAALRVLPVADANRLMAISATSSNGVAGETLSFAEIRDFREQTSSWQGVAAYAPLLAGAIQPRGEQAKRYWGFLVTGNYFDVVQPGFAAGGGFIDGEDDVRGAPAKVVLSHSLWTTAFGSDRSIVGREIRLNERAMTVVGVTDGGFAGTEVALQADFFLPFSQIEEMQRLGDSPGRMTEYGADWLYAIARLRDDASLAQAQTELAAVAEGIREREPRTRASRTFRAERAGQLLASVRRMAIPALLLLSAITLLVLLTTCANVANLMLARASARGREIATRLAIGAGRGRLIRQLTVESLLLAFSGGLLGVGLAALASLYLASFQLPLPIPVNLTAPIDSHVLLFAVGLSLAAAVVFGLVPAFRSAQTDLNRGLHSDAMSSGSLRRFGLRNALVVGQVAISAALVICSVLFLRSFDELRRVETGMDTDDVLLVRFDPSLNHYSEDRTRQLLAEALQDFESLPGVQSASIVDRLPLSFGTNNTAVRINFDAPNSEWTPTAVMAVGPRYFGTLGIRLNGQDFSAKPLEERTAVLNEELAARLFPERNAIGQTFFYRDTQLRVAGIAANTKAAAMAESQAQPVFYRPILEGAINASGFGGFTLMVKTVPNAGLTNGVLMERLRSLDPTLVIEPAGTLETHVQESLLFPRVTSMLLSTSGLMGLLIAAVGIYGIVSFAAARRTWEIGIRLALGARPAQVTWMILRHGALLAIVGIAFGLAGGAALTTAAGSLIYGVSATDPLTFAVVPLILLSVAMIATVIPARRAARVNPNRTLRVE